MGDRWASDLLSWEYRPPLLVAEVSRARYLLRVDPHEVIAWCELRDVSGGRRIEIGSYPAVSAAKAACERDAAVRIRNRDPDSERSAVDVRISPNRRRPGKADKGRELPAANYRPRDPADAGAALEVALAAFADVIGDAG
jgi:hypothetical protein